VLQSIAVGDGSSSISLLHDGVLTGLYSDHSGYRVPVQWLFVLQFAAIANRKRLKK
jgi:hypothetical protein